jgi:hypothetical protein
MTKPTLAVFILCVIFWIAAVATLIYLITITKFN